MTIEGKIIKVTENEEPPTVLIQFEDGTVTEYTLDDLIGMYVTGEKTKATQPEPFSRG